MAVSSSSDLSKNAQKLIKGAMRLLGVLGKGESLSSDDQADALEAFELMVKSWEADGVHLWTLAEATLFPTADATSYSLPGARAVSTYVKTAVAADASSGASSFTVDSISGISDGDVIGMQLDSDTIQWDTVNGSPSGSTITIDGTLDDDLDEDSNIYAYDSSNLIVRPLKIPSARRYNNGIDTELTRMSRDEYFNYPDKETSSTVTQYYYDPSRATGKLYVIQPSDNVNDLIKFTYYRPIYDLDAVTNDPDFPQEWLETLKYNLAIAIAPEYGVQPQPVVFGKAEQLYARLMTWDSEDSSIYFRPGK